MHRRRLIFALALTPALWAGDNDRFKEDFRFNHKLNSGGRVTLEGFNGSIEITGWEKNEIEITGTKYASREDLLKSIRINISNTDSAITIRTEKPVERSWWNNGGGGVRYVLRVPRKVQLERISSSNGRIMVNSLEGPARLITSNGGIDVTSLTGVLDAATSNGGINLQDIKGEMILRTSNGTIRGENITGAFEAQTSNGAIRARLTPASSSSLIRASSSNGTIDLTMDRFENNEIRATTSNSSITLNLPSQINAQLRAGTSNGSVSTDYEIAVRGKQEKNRLDGRIGNGGALIDLNSSNGAIRIRKI